MAISKQSMIASFTRFAHSSSPLPALGHMAIVSSSVSSCEESIDSQMQGKGAVKFVSADTHIHADC